MDKRKKHIINVCKNFEINYIFNVKIVIEAIENNENLLNEIIFSHLF